MDESPAQRLHRFAKLGTIDLWVAWVARGEYAHGGFGCGRHAVFNGGGGLYRSLECQGGSLGCAANTLAAVEGGPLE